MSKDITWSEMVRRADFLVAADERLMSKLVEKRRTSGLSQADVDEVIGWSPGHTAEFEAHWSDPTLSEVRRYSLAVGAATRHIVRDFREPKET